MSKEKTSYEISKTIRGTWGNVNPVTRIHDNSKKKKKKDKEKLNKEIKAYENES